MCIMNSCLYVKTLLYMYTYMYMYMYMCMYMCMCMCMCGILNYGRERVTGVLV